MRSRSPRGPYGLSRAGDDQHRTSLRVRRVDLASDHGLKFAAAAWKSGSPAPGTEYGKVQLLRLVLADRVREAVAELLVAERDRAVPVRGVLRRATLAARSAESGSGVRRETAQG